MSRKKSILSNNDAIEYVTLYKKMVGEKLDEEVILKFLKHLEKNYEIDNFKVGDYLKATRQSFAVNLSTYADQGRYHSSEAYVILYVYLACHVKDKKGDSHAKDIDKYINNQIRRLETILKSSRDDSFLEEEILKLLVFLVTIHSSRDNVINFIKVYRKLINLTYETEKLNRNFWDFRTKLSQRFPDMLVKYLDRISNLYDSGFEIFGNNPKLIDSIINAMNFATDDEPCLILGETGTGKEIIARIIHGFSHRKNNRFCPVNCGGFTESLFNSEISGIHWSAATGIDTRLGAFLNSCKSDDGGSGYYIHGGYRGEIRFQLNNNPNIENPTAEELATVGGTCFLDEINSIPLGLQSKLLRIIQEKEVQVVGEDRTRKFHNKLICASNVDLRNQDKEQFFREDLFFRISRGVVRLPTLREMRESIRDIAELQIRKWSEKLGLGKKNIVMTERACKKLENYKWPGNIRELENVIYSAIKNMLIEGDAGIDHRHINLNRTSEPKTEESENFFSNMTYYDIEKKYMEYLWEKANGNATEAMRLGGFGSRSPIYRLLKRYSLRK